MAATRPPATDAAEVLDLVTEPGPTAVADTEEAEVMVLVRPAVSDRVTLLLAAAVALVVTAPGLVAMNANDGAAAVLEVMTVTVSERVATTLVLLVIGAVRSPTGPVEDGSSSTATIAHCWVGAVMPRVLTPIAPALR